MEKWYKKGLYFKCKKNCSYCCSGTPGYIWIDEKDIANISAFLKISREKFLKNFTKTARNKISLIEKKINSNYDCIFLVDNKCSIYPVRPIQCKTYPFWNSCLASKEAFDNMKCECPGINDKSGKLYSFDEIEKMRKETIKSI